MAKKTVPFFGATKHVGEKALDAVFEAPKDIVENPFSHYGFIMKNFFVIPVAVAATAAAFAIDVVKSPIVLAMNGINKARDAKSQDAGMDGAMKTPHATTEDEKVR